uniref:VWFA domain-containing protein n=1 Tax=Mesocestoides corti TaxID=53468 RepID=A0A5K3FIW9_MESCO
MPTIRDLLAWVEFIHNLLSRHGVNLINVFTACLHGAAFIFLDSLETTDGIQCSELLFSRDDVIQHVNDSDLFKFSPIGGINYLLSSLLVHFHDEASAFTDSRLLADLSQAACEYTSSLNLQPGRFEPVLKDSNRLYGCHPFFIETGPLVSPDHLDTTEAPLPFSLRAPTPASNLCRLLRALQLPKRAILLEGSPGVGKTSLVMALARASGHSVVRINLSESTEACDLLGCDLPVEGAGCGNFAWRDGPLLQALRQGHWILLDEMNLASQSVLECLNACLDHRGAIYIPELGKTFHVKPRATRLFACQNPVDEGGGRKALPKSFLNRFTQVYLKPLTAADQVAVLRSIFTSLPAAHVEAMVKFNSALEASLRNDRSFAAAGCPWEFNLRDLCRWGDLILQGQHAFGANPGLYVYLLYAARMRSVEDRTRVVELWNQVAADHVDDADLCRCYVPQGQTFPVEGNKLQIGLSTWRVDGDLVCGDPSLLVLNQHRPYLEMLLKILQLGWMSIVVGPRGAGKRSLVHLAAFLTRRKIATFSLSPSADTVELLGAFEQRESGGIFAWIDSPLVNGIREGHWVLLENAQLCSPSALDRLNSLLEHGGDLLINERGLDASGNLVRLKPHPDFRLILTVDENVDGGLSVCGSNNISRAMRNRGVELVLTQDLTIPKEDLERLLLNTGLASNAVLALLAFESTALDRVTKRLSAANWDTTTFLSIRKPPVGALLSAGRIIQQLLAQSSRSLFPEGTEWQSASDAEACQAEGVVWINRWNDNPYQRAFAKALLDIYVKRQADWKVAEAFNAAITAFVEDELLAIINAPPTSLAPQLNRALELLTSKSYLVDEWRYVLRRVSNNGHYLQSMFRRLSTERGFTVSPERHGQIQSFIDGITEGSCMDKRWIPGWRCVVNSSLKARIPSWDGRITGAFIEEFDALLREATSGQANQPGAFTHTTCVLFAVDQFSKGNVPPDFSESYSGLDGVASELSAGYQAFRQTCESDVDFYRFLSSLARFYAWLRHFGSQPIGRSSDWSERREFFRRFCRSQATSTRLMELIQRYHVTPSPRQPPVCETLDLCHIPWSQVALEAQDQISNFLYQHDGDEEKDDATTPHGSSSLYLRLWPVLTAGMVFALAGKAEALTTAAPNRWSPQTSNRLRVELGLGLGALARPRLLDMLASASEKAAESDDGDVSKKVALCRRFYSPLELANPAGLVKPDLTQEWRTLSQAVFTLSRSDHVSTARGDVECSFANWTSYQQISSDLFHLLQRLAPLCSSNARILHQPTEELPQLLDSSKSLFCTILTALHKYHRGQMSSSSQKATSLQDLVSPLLDCTDMSSFVEVLGTSVVNLIPENLVSSSFYRLLRAFYVALKNTSSSESVARAWIIWGALQMMCSYPASPLDPNIVNAYKVAITTSELDSLNADISVRGTIRRIQFGSCGLPCVASDHTGCQDSATVQSNVEAGLEHPLVGAIVRRRDKVAAKLERLQARQVVELENEAARQRAAASNSQYAELRRRLAAFNQNFTGDFLLNLLSQPCGATSSHSFHQWIEAAADLADWFLQPDHLHQYADVVEPYLLGVAKVVHGLRTLVNLEVAKNDDVASFTNLVEALSSGLFPFLATRQPPSRPALSPCLQLVRQLVSPKVRAALRSAWSGSAASTKPSATPQSIFTDSRDVDARLRQNALLQVEAEHRLNSHILDLLLLDCLTMPGSSEAAHRMEFISRILKAITGQLAVRWRRSEAQRKRDAERRAALFIEAENKRRRCLNDLQTSSRVAKSSKASSKMTRAEKRRRRQERLDTDDLPELVDAGLNEEVEWRLRFSEAGAIDAQRCLSDGSASFLELHLSRDDQIRQTVRKIEQVNSWYEQELATVDEAQISYSWMPPNSEVVSFVDRLVYLLNLTSTRNEEVLKCVSVDQHWWSTFMQGYRLAGHLLANSKHQLPVASDGICLPAHQLATARLALNACDPSQAGEGECLFAFDPLLSSTGGTFVRRRRCLNVYRDRIPVAEARKAHQMMNAVRTRVLEVLDDWPEHPALLKILTVINRMGGFAMSDCLMKYITAFEMLLAEMQEWEKNAARHVSLVEPFKSVCALLVDWRKLELKCWMASLDAATQASADGCAPLWFHLYGVFLHPTAEFSTAAVEDQCQVLLEFMENGPVGEFHARWRLLDALHRAIGLWPGLSDQQRSASQQAVGNVVWFYRQFLPHVNKFLLDQQKPIRKEMRGFISVVKWGDYVGFWTMKDNVDRCKRTIHKHIRTWEGILRQSVKPCFEAAIQTGIEVPISDATFTTSLQDLQSLQRLDLGIFELSSDLRTWLSKRADETNLPVNIRRLPVLISRFKKHVSQIASTAPCIAWIHQLRDCLEGWCGRVKELSSATQQLDSESPSHSALVVLLKEKEAGYEPTKRKATQEKDADEMRKAKDWIGRYSALQQNKKLALSDWFRLAFGRRRLVASSCDDQQPTSAGSFEDEDIEESPVSQEPNTEDDEDDFCLGLSYRRGLRKGFFDKPRGHFLSSLGCDLWRCPSVSPSSPLDHLEQLLSTGTLENLQKSASASFARLVSLRSGLPKHPDNPEVVDDLGGREGVERLIGSLDDLMAHCADAFAPLSNLFTTFQSLKRRFEEMHVSYGVGLQADAILPCSSQIMLKLKASRQRIADLASECVRQWTRFSETCSSITAPPSEALSHLLLANSGSISLESPACGLSKALADSRSQLEDLACRLDQRISPACIAITGDVLSQQKLLEAVAHDFVECCQTINSQTCPDTTLLSSLLGVASSISAEVEASGELIASVRQEAASKPFATSLNSIISKILVSLQNLKLIDEKVHVERGSIDRMTSCISALSVSCLNSLTAVASHLRKLTPHTAEEVSLLRLLTPLLTALLEAVSARLRQLWCLLAVWLTLGEFMAQVAFRLLNDGFCKPSALSKATASVGSGKEGSSADGNATDSRGGEGDDDGGCTSLTAEGVDASGAKDVSKELQSEEQIEGTLDQRNQQAGRDDKELPKPDSADGIEMTEDFDGAFDDGGGREEKKEDDGDGEADEDNLDGIDEQMGEAADEPDEINQEMWASENEEEKDAEEGEKEERKNADTDEPGVEERGGTKSKQSKSTAKGTKNQPAKFDDVENTDETGEVNDDDDDGGADDDDSKTATTVAKQDEQPASGGGETVAGNAHGEESKENDADATEALKQDEAALAQKEAEMIESEEGMENPNEEDVEHEFGENMDLQPNPEDFEDMDDTQVPEGEIELNAEPMEIDGEEQGNNDDGDAVEIDANESAELAGKKTSDELITEHQSAFGDLNTGHSIGSQDQRSGANEDDAGSGDAEEARTGGVDNQVDAQPGRYSTGLPSERRDVPQSETASRRPQRSRGPRPTSERRTTKDGSSGDDDQSKPLRQTEILDAEEDVNPGGEESETPLPDAVQHVEGESDTKLTVLDSATDAQKDQQQQQMEQMESTDADEEDSLKPGLDPNNQMPEPMQQEEAVVESKPLMPKRDLLSATDEFHPDGEAAAGSESRSLPKVDMEIIDTLGAERGPESKFYTQKLDAADVVGAIAPLMPQGRVPTVDRDALINAAVDWRDCVSRSSMMSVQLCEALRLVLEPTRASRMKGDFRTGKRLNMRKIIPYLASQFRKDKIWMRRTQPSQRDYRILIAVDNSSSMADNLCKQMTFEALATVVCALNLLEAGKIGVCSFGESVEVVHGLGEPWNNEVGASMLAHFDFKQSRTSLTELLQTSITLMRAAGEGTGKSLASQLLLILSDGVFSEDPQHPKLQAAVRMARDHHLFIVCIIIDDVRKKHSIFDLRKYAGPGRLLPYMDIFPLPYYLVLRDVTALPQLLADALRQWFELASAM